METVLDSPEHAIEASTRSANQGLTTDWAIRMSIDVNADARRIFHALTVPEYLEAWIRIPDQAAGSRVAASEIPNGYRLDYSVQGPASVTIVASYLFRHYRKMRLFWQSTRSPILAGSLVDFRLRGNFASSILEIRHAGFASPDEYAWHRKLWRGSAKTLAALLRFA